MVPITALVYFVVVLIQGTIGARLLVLSRTTRRSPELLWGMAWVIAALLNLVLFAQLFLTDAVWQYALTVCSVGLYSLHGISVFFSTWRIFRARERWAAVCVTAISAGLVGLFLHQWFFGEIVVHLGQSYSQVDTITWACRIVAHSAFLWATYEGVRAFRMAVKRRRIGLEDSLTVARILMWVGAGIAIVLYYSVLILNGLLGFLPSTLGQAVLVLTTLIAFVLMWAAFFPPLWLERRLGVEAVDP